MNTSKSKYTTEGLYPQARTLIRRLAGLHSRETAVPVEVIEGDSPPKLHCPRRHAWETITGKPVYHPNAYRRAYGRPIYIGYGRYVTVGADWLPGHV